MINEAARGILEDRYLLPGEKNEDDMFKRSAKAISKAMDNKDDAKHIEKALYEAMRDGIIMPNTPALMNLGTDNQMCSACFVLPIEDSMDGIFKTLGDMAKVQKAGGGTGFSFSGLRPEMALVGSTGGKSSGPISFLKVYDDTTGVVKQAGKRRGASMGVFNISHPDVEQFIECKDKDGDISNFNLSTMLTDKFMKAVRDGRKHKLVWDGKTVKTVDAKELFAKIVRQSWKNGEPGVLFYDTINNEDPPENFEKVPLQASNPCGEQLLPPYGSCNLSAINFGEMVSGDHVAGFQLDEDKLSHYVELNVRMLDAIIDINDYPIKEIGDHALKNRPIGAGAMGFADLLIKLKVTYGSDECIDLIHKIMRIYRDVARTVSTDLGGGVRKNIALMTMAPTGTTSMLCDASAGIEPYFNFWFERRYDNKQMLMFEGILEGHITDEDRDYITECFDNKTTVDRDKISLPEYFVKSDEIPWKDHVRVQAAFQKYIDNSISKTINLPNDATEQDVHDAIFLAWESKCKGLTVYRDGSRDEQVLTSVGGGSTVEEVDSHIVKGEILLPNELEAKSYRIKASLGLDKPDQTFYIHIGLLDGDPVQIFIDYKRQSDSENPESQLKAQMIESLGMSISYQLRYGVPLTVLIKQLSKIPFSWMMSLHIKISKILEGFLDKDALICDSCGSQIVFREGCQSCSCGKQNKCG